LTLDGAERLIRTRLRQYLLRKAQAVESEAPLDLVLDFGMAIEASAESSWHNILMLWPTWNTDADVREALKSCIQQAFDRSIQHSAVFIGLRQDQNKEDVGGWVQEFVRDFSADSLLVPLV
jgi:hypothetical protein